MFEENYEVDVTNWDLIHICFKWFLCGIGVGVLLVTIPFMWGA